MAYRVELTPDARKSLKRVPADVQERVLAALFLLGQTPRPSSVKKLSDKRDLYRIRVGDYRVLYRIQDTVLLVLVVKIGHRRDVYRGP